MSLNAITSKGRKLLTSRGARDAALVYFGYCFRFISPLLLYPLLTRRLGLDMFGVYAAAYSLALMLSVIVEYGFNLTGTRDVAATIDPVARGRIAARVVAAKLVLIPISALAGVALGLSNPVLVHWPMIIGMAVLLGCGQGATAFWYFQGVRKVLTAVVLEVGGQLAALIAIALLVRSPSDVTLTMAFQTLGIGVAAVLGSVLMFREVPARAPSATETIDTLRDGFAIFLSRAAIVAYTTASVFLLAALSGPVQAALYGAAERVTSAAVALLRPLSSLVLPRLAGRMAADRLGAFLFAKKVLLGTGAAYVVIALGIIGSAHWLYPLMFGQKFGDGSAVMQVLAISLPLVALNSVLGSQLMVALRLDGKIALIAFVGAAANLLLAMPLSKKFGGMGMACARVAAEASILVVYVALLGSHRAELFSSKRSKFSS